MGTFAFIEEHAPPTAPGGDYSICILVSLGVLGFYEFASQVYRVGCTEWNGTGFGGVACLN